MLESSLQNPTTNLYYYYIIKFERNYFIMARDSQDRSQNYGYF